MKGNLRTRPLADLLNDLGKARRTGLLTLTRGDEKRQAAFVKGALRHAASNLRSDQLGPKLTREGVVTEEALRGLEPLLAAGKRMGVALFESGTLPAETVHEVLHRHLQDLLIPCFEWTQGSFSFAEGVPDLAGEVRVEVPVLELLLERARRSPAARGLGQLRSRPDALLARAYRRAEALRSIPLTPLEKKLLSRADGSLTVDGALALFDEGEEAILRSLQALIQVAAIEVRYPEREAASAGSESSSREAPHATPAREPIPGTPEEATNYYLDLVQRLEGANHYNLLGLATSAGSREIREAYYRLARDLHPDRFGSADLVEIRPQMEGLFARITEAYNALSDPVGRQEYDATLRMGGGAAGTAAAPAESAPSPQVVARANYLRARELVAEGKLPKAITFLQNAVELDSSKPEYLLLLGSVQAQHPLMREEALKNIESSITLDPTRPLAYLERARLYKKLGRTAEAEESFNAVLRLDPLNKEAGQELREGVGASSAGKLRGLFGRGKRE